MDVTAWLALFKVIFWAAEPQNITYSEEQMTSFSEAVFCIFWDEIFYKDIPTFLIKPRKPVSLLVMWGLLEITAKGRL